MSNTHAPSDSASGGSLTVAIIGATAEATTIRQLCGAQGLVTMILATAAEGRVAPGDADGMANCSLLVDARAVGDSQRIQSLRDVEAALPDSAVLAVVARHRPIGAISDALRRPASFAGIALSSTEERQPLVEVIRTAATSQNTVARLVDWAARSGAKPLVVRDVPGFFATRLSQVFFNEAMAMVGEGVPASQVEKAAVDSGLGSGPLALLDRMSLKLSDDLLHQELHDLEQDAAGNGGRKAGHDHDHEHDHDNGHGHGQDHEHGHDHAPGHAHHHDRDHPAHAHEHDGGDAHAPDQASAHTHEHARGVKSRRMPEPAVYVMEKMAHGFRRMGREAGAGFYEYEDDGTASLWSGLKAFERRTTRLPVHDIRDRLLFIEVLEAARCVEEGVVGSFAEADAALVHLGLFPGAGAAQFLNRMGTRAFVERAQALAAAYGARFEPSAGLVDRAGRGGPFDVRAASTRFNAAG